MEKKPLLWKVEPGSAPDSAFGAQLGKLITYYAVTRTHGHRPTLNWVVGAVA
jgi:hypothetical protein